SLLAFDLLHDHGVEVVDELGALDVAVVAEQRAHAGGAGGEHHQHGTDLHGLLDRVGDEHDGAPGLAPDAAHFLLHDAAVLGVEGAEQLLHQEGVGVHRGGAGARRPPAPAAPPAPPAVAPAAAPAHPRPAT